MLFVHCLKKIPQPLGLVSGLPEPDRPELGASTVAGSASCSAAFDSVTGIPSVLSLARPPSDPASGVPVLSPLPPPPRIGPGHVLHL